MLYYDTEIIRSGLKKNLGKESDMLLKKESVKDIDYLQNWPEHYYEIETASKRKEYLEKALNQKLDPIYDPYRMNFLEKRFFSQKKKETTDAFMHAWMMIKASSATGVSFFGKKRQQQELVSYMKELCLFDYKPESEEEVQVLHDEWEDFAKRWISSCVGSKNYCSTLFGLVRIKDAAIATKMIEEIDLVTRTYPANFQLSQAFLPFREILISVYCQMIEDGSSYLEQLQP